MLYIIPTPIGNLKDITFRAVSTLKEADFIIAENPAHTAKLLQHYEILKKPNIQFAEYNETQILPKLIDRLKGENGALVSDAGTPGISDPGFRLVRACIEAEIKVEALPGANAAITALSASGLPTDKFLFFGFLAKTEHKVIEALEKAKTADATAIFYESPERLKKTIAYIAKHYPIAMTVIARELTKLHEEYIRGTVSEVSAELKNRPNIKGEITIVLSWK